MFESRGTRPPKGPAAGGSDAADGVDLHAFCLISGWLSTQLRAIGDKLFREDDSTARKNGWEIEHGRLGLSRTYHDRRFNTPRPASGTAPEPRHRGMQPTARCTQRDDTASPGAPGRR